MGRVIHIRLYGLDDTERDSMQSRFAYLAAGREWRDQPPWLADARSAGLFEQLYFTEALEHESRERLETGVLSAAGFVRVAGDETDALAVVFMLRDLSERFAVRVVIRDPDNPIAKLRRIELDAGRLPDGRGLETMLVRRTIFQRL